MQKNVIHYGPKVKIYQKKIWSQYFCFLFLKSRSWYFMICKDIRQTLILHASLQQLKIYFQLNSLRCHHKGLFGMLNKIFTSEVSCLQFPLKNVQIYSKDYVKTEWNNDSLNKWINATILLIDSCVKRHVHLKWIQIYLIYCLLECNPQQLENVLLYSITKKDF